MKRACGPMAVTYELLRKKNKGELHKALFELSAFYTKHYWTKKTLIYPSWSFVSSHLEPFYQWFVHYIFTPKLRRFGFRNYVVLGSKITRFWAPKQHCFGAQNGVDVVSTLFWAPKWRRFAQNDVVLAIKIIYFIFFLKKNIKKKKKKKKSGVAWATSMTGMGVVEPPSWPRGWPGYP